MGDTSRSDELSALRREQEAVDEVDAETTRFELAEPFAPLGIVDPQEAVRLQRIGDLESELKDSPDAQ